MSVYNIFVSFFIITCKLLVICYLTGFLGNYFKKNVKKVKKTLDILVVRTYIIYRDEESRNRPPKTPNIKPAKKV